MMTFKTMVLASVLKGSVVVSGQQVIFLPMAQPSSQSSPFDPLPSLNTPPAKSSGCRLEPYRQQIREQCHVDAATYCPRVERPCPFRSLNSFNNLGLGDQVPPPPHRNFPPLRLLDDEDFFNSFFKLLDDDLNDFFGNEVASSTTNIEKEDNEKVEESRVESDNGFVLTEVKNGKNTIDIDSFDSLFDNLIGFSLGVFDSNNDMEKSASALDSSAEVVEATEDNMNESNDANEPDLIDERVEQRKRTVWQTPEQAAEDALDLFVASLFQRAGSSSDVNDGDMEQASTKNEPKTVISVETLPARLAQLGNNMLTDLHSRRRLSEQTEGDAIADPHSNMRERIARRLTEYRTDLFYYPDGSVTVYTSSIPSSLSSPTPFDMFPSLMGLRTLEDKLDSSPPILGMGSHEMDDCIYSLYKQGDLVKSCHAAVEEYLEASANPPAHPNRQAKILEDSFRRHPEQSQTMHYSQQQQEKVATRTICIESLLVTLTAFSLISCCALCTGLLDAWNLLVSLTVAMATIFYGLKSLLVLLPMVVILDWMFKDEEEEEGNDEGGNDEEDDKEGYVRVYDDEKDADKDDEDDDGCHPNMDYVQMSDSRGTTPSGVKKGKTMVFIGVPVQVV